MGIVEVYPVRKPEADTSQGEGFFGPKRAAGELAQLATDGRRGEKPRASSSVGSRAAQRLPAD